MASETNWSEKLDGMPDVDIDAEGKFKYIQIKVRVPRGKPEDSKIIVRGYRWAAYHADILDQVEEDAKKLGLKCKVQGGGRILHEPEKKSIMVYGYSQGFGKANHEISVDILKNKFPDYEIKWSNEGY